MCLPHLLPATLWISVFTDQAIFSQIANIIVSHHAIQESFINTETVQVILFFG